jgi:hypothetical protein
MQLQCLLKESSFQRKVFVSLSLKSPGELLQCRFLDSFPNTCTTVWNIHNLVFDFFFFFLWDRILLCSPSWPQTLSPPALVSQVLGLQALTTILSSQCFVCVCVCVCVRERERERKAFWRHVKVPVPKNFSLFEFRTFKDITAEMISQYSSWLPKLLLFKIF